MTTELQAEILLTALREWSGRWRHPATAVGLAEGHDPPAPADLSRAFLTDLSRMDTAVTACQRLISLGEFETVMQLLAEEPLDPDDRAALTAERDKAVARRVADVRYSLASLRRRSELAGRALDLDSVRLEEQAARSYPPAADMLAKAEGRAAEAERDARRELWAAATAAATATPGDATRWLSDVRTSLTLGDFAEARRLLADGPREPDLQPRHGDPVSGLDEPGTNLAIALRALEDRITEHTVLDFVTALGDLTGTVAPRYEVRGSPGGVMVSVRSRWKDLPRWLALPNADGLTLWIAPSDQPPPTKSALAWVVVHETSTGGRPPPGFARLTADQLLYLALTETKPSTRLRGLLKLVCSQLDVTDVLNPHGRPLPTSDITDLLELLGLPSSPALAAALRYETGGRPSLIVELLTEVLTRPDARSGIGPATLQQARNAWWPRAFEALLEPYRDDHAGLLLLVAVAFHADQADGFTLEDLRKGIAAVAPDGEATVHLLSSPGLPAAAERLVRDGFFERHGGGVYGLPDDGVRHLLPLGPDGAGVRRHAEDAAVAACRRHLAETAELRAEIAALVIRMISHMLSGTMSAIRTELTFIERAHGKEFLESLARVRRYADPGQTLDEQFQRAMRPPEPCALHPLLQAMGEDQSWRSQGVIRVDLQCPPDLHVMANKWLLSQAFANMLDNARLAIKDAGAEFGTIRMIVTGDDACCAVEIADSGCGLTDERRGELGIWRPVPSTRGRGVGLLHSRRWFERYGGHLEIKPRNSDLGGAWFLVELPRCNAPLG